MLIYSYFLKDVFFDWSLLLDSLGRSSMYDHFSPDRLPQYGWIYPGHCKPKMTERRYQTTFSPMYTSSRLNWETMVLVWVMIVSDWIWIEHEYTGNTKCLIVMARRHDTTRTDNALGLYSSTSFLIFMLHLFVLLGRFKNSSSSCVFTALFCPVCSRELGQSSSSDQQSNIGVIQQRPQFFISFRCHFSKFIDGNGLSWLWNQTMMAILEHHSDQTLPVSLFDIRHGAVVGKDIASPSIFLSSFAIMT